MESKVTSSFIPDKMPGAPKTPSQSVNVKRAGADIVVVLAIVVFAVSLTLSAGVFLYERYLIQEAKTKSEQLRNDRKVLEPATIRALMRLDKRLSAAQIILSNHIAPSAIFDILENLTLKSVYFKNLDYFLAPDKTPKIKMHGVAKTVNGVAYQSDVFGKNRAIVEPVFSSINIVRDGVEFDVAAEIDKSTLNYAVVSAYRAQSANTSSDTSNSNQLNMTSSTNFNQ